MRKYLTTIILALTLPLGELHTYWINDTRVQNWIYAINRPMLISWNVKFVVSELSVIAYFAAWILWKSNIVNRTTIVAFFWLAIVDMILYFYNYKTGQNYGIIYFGFAIFFWVTVYLYKWRNRKTSIS